MSIMTQKANRILTMIPLIRSRPGIKIEELARQLGVSPRIIMSDLDSVLMCGAPPYLPNDYVGVYVENGGVRIGFADHFRRPITLTYEEGLSLHLALEDMPASAGQRASRLVKKLERLLPGRLEGRSKRGRSSPRRFSPPWRVAPGPLREKIRAVSSAVAERIAVRIEYYTAGRDVLTRRTVRPYAIVEHQGQWYMVGYCQKRRRELPFRIDRIRWVKMTGRRFAAPEDFDIATYSRPEMYFPTTAAVSVEVRVASDFAGRLRTLKPEERAGVFGGQPAIRSVRRQEDGALIITLAVSSPEWIVSWALQHGESVEILSPPDVRERVKRRCDKLSRLYA